MSHFDLPPATGRPLEQTLPSRVLPRSRMYARERERIFCREWLCVGREAELPNAGDSKVLDVLGESILLVRNEAGALRGFYNVCRHRGAQLCGTVLPGRATPGGVPVSEFAVRTIPGATASTGISSRPLISTASTAASSRSTRSGWRPGVDSYSST
jgi:hypothetical protein